MKLQLSEGLCNRILKALEEKAHHDSDASGPVGSPLFVGWAQTQAWRDHEEVREALRRMHAEPRKDFGKFSGRRNKN